MNIRVLIPASIAIIVNVAAGSSSIPVYFALFFFFVVRFVGILLIVIYLFAPVRSLLNEDE